MGFAKRELMKFYGKLVGSAGGEENEAEVVIQVLAAAKHRMIIAIGSHLGKMWKPCISWKECSANGD